MSGKYVPIETINLSTSTVIVAEKAFAAKFFCVLERIDREDNVYFCMKTGQIAIIQGFLKKLYSRSARHTLSITRRAPQTDLSPLIIETWDSQGTSSPPC